MRIDPAVRIETCASVYAPAEDTFLLLSAIRVVKGQRVLEMGCGTGIIALHCAKAECKVTVADVSAEALDCARHNAGMNGLKIESVRSDLFENLEGKYDVIIFNPPYLSSGDSDGLSVAEKVPLVGGEMGHEITVRFLREAGNFLTPGGRIFLLTSSESEAGVIEAAGKSFIVHKVSEKRIFFETLAVHLLEMAKH